MHLMGIVVDAGRALVVAVNKWDHLDTDIREKIRETLKRRLSFIAWAKIHYISALHGTVSGFVWVDSRGLRCVYYQILYKWSCADPGDAVLNTNLL